MDKNFGLNLNSLVNPKFIADYVRTQCPACNAGGGDTDQDNLRYWPASGAYHCIAFGDDKSHNAAIKAIAGPNPTGVVYTPPPYVPQAHVPLDASKFVTGTPAQIIAVAKLRGLSVEAIQKASDLGVLKFGKSCGSQCWVLIDSDKIIEARRMDGMKFESIENGPSERKAHTLRGSVKFWPVGLSSIDLDATEIAIVEGGPDYLAALHFGLSPIAMMGRGCRMSPDAVKILTGKKIRIYPHADEDGGGVRAAQIWAEQLQAVGCSVALNDFQGLIQENGKPAKDLNDAAFVPEFTFKNQITIHKPKPENPLGYNPDELILNSDGVPWVYVYKSDFLVADNLGTWRILKPDAFRRRCFTMGFDCKGIVHGQPDSQVDHMMNSAMANYTVDNFGSLAGFQSGLIQSAGKRFLVTDGAMLLSPVKGEFPLIRRIIASSLGGANNDLTQIHVFTGWLKTYLKSLYNGGYQASQALLLVGTKGDGKSFIQDRIITPLVGGRSDDAKQWVLGEVTFNSSLYGAEHLALQDLEGKGTLRERNALAGRLKAMVAASRGSGMVAKGRDQVSLSPKWIISISCNDDERSLAVMPTLEESFEDKLIILNTRPINFGMDNSTIENRAILDKILSAEIPAFLEYLLAHEIPDEFKDVRYGVTSWKHPSLTKKLNENEPDLELRRFIICHFDDARTMGNLLWTAEQIQDYVFSVAPGVAERVFPARDSARSAGRVMARLAKQDQPVIEFTRGKRCNKWKILPVIDDEVIEARAKYGIESTSIHDF